MAKTEISTAISQNRGEITNERHIYHPDHGRQPPNSALMNVSMMGGVRRISHREGDTGEGIESYYYKYDSNTKAFSCTLVSTYLCLRGKSGKPLVFSPQKVFWWVGYSTVIGGD